MKFEFFSPVSAIFKNNFIVDKKEKDIKWLRVEILNQFINV